MSIYQLCNRSVDNLFLALAKTASCSSLAAIVFPSRQEANWKGMPSSSVEAVCTSSCYQDLILVPPLALLRCFLTLLFSAPHQRD